MTKYLIGASGEHELKWFIIGISAIRFSSIEIHMSNQFEEDTIKMVDRIITKMSIIILGVDILFIMG